MVNAYLQSKHTNTTSSLHQHSLTRFQRLQTEQSVPASKRGTREGTRFQRIEIARRFDEAILIVDTILAERTINHTSETSRGSLRGHITVLVALVEQSCYLVTLLEFRHLLADLNNLACAIGCRNNGESEREGV